MAWVSQYWSDNINPNLCVDTFDTKEEAEKDNKKCHRPDRVYFDERYASGISQGENGVFVTAEALEEFYETEEEEV